MSHDVSARALINIFTLIHITHGAVDAIQIALDRIRKRDFLTIFGHTANHTATEYRTSIEKQRSKKL